MSADNTLRRRLKAATTETVARDSLTETSAMEFDTICQPDSLPLRLAGYDKPLTSSTETIFLTNGLDLEISEIEIELTYIDMSDRQLHKSVRRIRQSIPAGETRQLRFKSWDSQKSFYYHLSRRPRTSGVTPYKVKAVITSVITLKNP